MASAVWPSVRSAWPRRIRNSPAAVASRPSCSRMATSSSCRPRSRRMLARSDSAGRRTCAASLSSRSSVVERFGRSLDAVQMLGQRHARGGVAGRAIDGLAQQGFARSILVVGRQLQPEHDQGDDVGLVAVEQGLKDHAGALLVAGGDGPGGFAVRAGFGWKRRSPAFRPSRPPSSCRACARPAPSRRSRRVAGIGCRAIAGPGVRRRRQGRRRATAAPASAPHWDRR